MPDQVEAAARAAIRRSGGNVGGGFLSDHLVRRLGLSLGRLRGGKVAMRAVVASVIWATARSNASAVSADVFWTPLTLRTY